MTASASSASSAWLARWAGLTAVAAIIATLADSALLQRRYGYFTGGFLSVDHLKSPAQTFAFLGGSVVADAAVVGVLVAMALWILARTRLNRSAVSGLAITLALAPIAVADVISYRLHQYLGDAFDLALMFDLAGRSPAELFAVSSSQVMAGVSLLAGGGLAVGAVVWMLDRFGSSSSLDRPFGRPTAGALASVAATTVLIGVLTTTALRAGSEELDHGLRRKPVGRLLGSIVQYVTDIDGDGYGLLRHPTDPDLFDANIFPYAVDIPGNGIDENGVGGDLPLGREYRESAASAKAWRETPDVVFFLLESVRADSVGAVLDGRPVTPTLDALAAKGRSIEHAYSHNGYTVQSRHHILSGSLADLRDGTTLLDDFKANGYETAYFSAQDESFGNLPIDFSRVNVFFDARSAPAERYSRFTTAGSLALPAGVITERVAEFLRIRSPDQPLFLYVNFHDTHFPYHHADLEPLVSQTVINRSDIDPAHADELRSMYLNAVANVDRAIGNVLQDVQTATGRQPAAIVLADHGESLFDEGFLGHGYALNDAQTRIPLVVSGLDIEMDEPFGQASLRQAIGAALRKPTYADVGQGQVLSTRSDGVVFQYLGNIRRPRQIAFVTQAGRTIYDFRTGRASIRSGPWRDVDDLSVEQDREFRHLLNSWERIVAAKTRWQDSRSCDLETCGSERIYSNFAAADLGFSTMAHALVRTWERMTLARREVGSVRSDG